MLLYEYYSTCGMIILKGEETEVKYLFGLSPHPPWKSVTQTEHMSPPLTLLQGHITDRSSACWVLLLSRLFTCFFL